MPRSETELKYPDQLKQTLSNHTGPVNVVRYNNQSSKYCLSGGADRSIRLWNPSTGKEVKVYKGHAYEVLSLDIAPDNATFASAGGDKAVLIWDVSSGTVIRRLQGHFGKVNAVKFGGSGAGAKDSGANVLVSGSFDSKVMVWDMRAQARLPMQTFQEARDSITSIAIPASIPEILVGSVDGNVRTYDLRMGKKIEDTIGAPVTSVVPSPTAPKDSVLISSLDSSLRLMDRSNGKLLATFASPAFKNTSYRSQCAFGYGESTVMAGDESGNLWVWGVIEAKPVIPGGRKIHSKVITWIEPHPTKSDELLTASADGTVKVWGYAATDDA